MSALSPFDHLKDIEARTLANSAGLPKEEDVLENWTGVGFFVGDQELLVPLNDVVEILDPIDCTRIPNVQPWFKGLGNVRGNLIPVMDFYHYLSGDSRPMTNSTRVIIFRDEGANAGLIVTSVIGMRHFQMDEAVERSQDLNDVLKSCVTHAFQRSGERWDVFSFSKLADTERFAQISVA